VPREIVEELAVVDAPDAIDLEARAHHECSWCALLGETGAWTASDDYGVASALIEASLSARL
jgi:hypothetical protein